MFVLRSRPFERIRTENKRIESRSVRFRNFFQYLVALWCSAVVGAAYLDTSCTLQYLIMLNTLVYRNITKQYQDQGTRLEPDNRLTPKLGYRRCLVKWPAIVMSGFVI